MTRISNFFALLRGKLWIIPLCLSALAFGLAYLVLTSSLELVPDRGEAEVWWLYSGDAQTARGLLSSLLGGLMTMTSLIVSLTFVILSLAANQLGPRLITTFMADRQIQVVLGLFLGTILYLILVLRSLSDSLGDAGVPHIAVTVGSALTILCLFALLFYVHKIARSIIADTMVARVGDELSRAIKALPTEPEDPEAKPPALPDRPVSRLSIGRSGYVQVIDYGCILAIASKADLLIEVDVRAGHFLLKNGEHVRVYGSRPLDDGEIHRVREAFVVGSERSPAQDLEYNFRQLVEVGLRALSPGINDLFTALAVIDRLGSALEGAFERCLPQRLLRDKRGAVRLIVQRTDEDGLADAAFDAIRQAGRDLPAVLIHMADVLRQIAPTLRKETARDAVARQLRKLRETAEAGEQAKTDAEDIRRRIDEAEAAIRHKAGGCGHHVL